MSKSFGSILRVAYVVVAFSWLSVAAMRADTPVSWANTSSSGNWSDPTQWNPAVSPNGAYSVTLPAGSETVTLDVSPTIDSLIVDSGATLSANAGMSLITGSLNNSGQVNVANGTTVSVDGDLTNSGGLFTGFRSGGGNTVNVSGTFTNTNFLLLDGAANGAGDIVNVNALSNQGRIQLDGGNTINITGGGLGITDVVGGSEIDLSGNFNVINGGVATSAIAHLVSVEGSLNLLGGQTYSFGSLTNSGGISLSNGTSVSVVGNVANSGSFFTGFRSGGGNTVNVSGTFTNTNFLLLDGAANGAGDIVNVNALSNQGRIQLDGGNTINITGGGLGITDVVGGSEIDLSGNFNVINGGVATSAIAHLVSVEGSLNLLGGQTYSFGSLTNSGQIVAQNGTTVSVTGNVTNSNTFYTTFHGGGNNTVHVSGTFNNTSNGNLTLFGSGDVVNVSALSNQGSVGVSGGALLGVGSGSFSASSGYQQLTDGTYDEVIGGSNSYGIATISGPVALGGTLDVTLANGFTPTLGESFTFLDGAADELSGDYASIVGTPFSGGQWQVSYDDAADTVTLTAIALPEPASLSLLALAAPMLMRRRRFRE